MNQESLSSILDAYPLGNLVNFEYVKEGVSDENYIVNTSAGKYFLKKHRQSAVARINAIEHAQEFFTEHGIPVVVPLRTKDNALHYMYGDWCYVIYPFLSGTTYSFGNVPDSCAVHMAELLARMHLLTRDGIPIPTADVSNYYLPRNVDELVEQVGKLLDTIAALDTIGEHDAVARNGLSIKKELLQRYRQQIENFSFSDKKMHLCHGDYHSGNMFFDSQSNITALFDFDVCGPAPRIAELVRAMMLVCFDYAYSSQDRIDQAKIFIKAYHKVYPFLNSEFEEAMEAYFFKSLSVWREDAHYYQKDGRTDGGYPDHIEGVRYFEQHRSSLTAQLLAAL